MGRPKKSAPAPSEPEFESQEIPEEPEVEEEIVEEEDEEETPAAVKKVSGAEAVRQAMADGLDAPGDIQGFVKSHYGLDIPKPMISSYKSQEKARQAKKEAAAPAARAPRKAPAETAPTPRATPAAQTGIIADIADIKRLLNAHGKDGLEELIKVLS